MKIDALFEQKGIVGKSLNLHEKCMRFAHVKQEGPVIHVLDLQELPLNKMDKVFVQMALQKFGVDAKTPLAINIDDRKIVAKKLFAPPIAKDELLEALRFQFLEESQGSQPNAEIRFEKLPEENEEGMQAYLVYGLAPEEVEQERAKCQEWGIHVVAAEPLATTLAAMADTLEMDAEKIRGIFYKEGMKHLFVGMKGTQLLGFKRLGASVPEGEEAPDWMIDFQQAIDEFLLQEKVSVLEEAVLVGDWAPEEKEKILMTLGIPCKGIGEFELGQYVFANPELKERFESFIPEIGLALFPKAIT